MARTFIWAGRALVVCAALLLSSGSNEALARGGHGGGGHGGGGHVGGGHIGHVGGGHVGGGHVAYRGAYRGGYGAYRGGYGYRGYYRPGYYGRGYGYYGGYYPYYGLGLGWGLGYPYYGYGSGYPYYGYSSYYYPYSSYGYSYPSYSGIDYTPPAEVYTDDSDVAPIGNAEQYTSTSKLDALNDNRAHITIRVPDENAVLTVNGLQMASTGKERYFQSPELTSGEYSYDVKAQWQVNGKPVTETKKVLVRPNTQSYVNFMPEDQ